ncbi:GNAT family N-acetyltransferase [Streptosporangium sp. DT93]|uniref:GNAT family N-acetyltransferase n=1 Tax=Streptosporangium sp. DT93 TaxID=3393428 RepID=UPI003CF806AB
MTALVRVPNTPEAAGEVGAIIATSFHDQDVSAWLIPPDDDRRRVMPHFFSMITEHALAHGEVHATADMSAVAVWFHHDTGAPPDVPGYDERLETFAGPHTERYRLMDEEMRKHHPEEAHHYLAFLAVLPGRQGRGAGSLLLEERHRELDAKGTAAYLEASGVDSRRLYLRHGYRDLGDPLVLPGGPSMFPMWRPPSP